MSTWAKKMHDTFHESIGGNPPLCPTPQQATQATLTPVTNYAVQNWTPSPQIRVVDRNNYIDYPVIELARGVPLDRLPTGDDRRLLTRVVEEVIRTNDHELMLSQVADYIIANGIDVGVTPMPANADQLAYQRLVARIRAYRAEMKAYANAHDIKKWN